jgi:hypothetical protein
LGEKRTLASSVKKEFTQYESKIEKKIPVAEKEMKQHNTRLRTGKARALQCPLQGAARLQEAQGCGNTTNYSRVAACLSAEFDCSRILNR